MKTKNYQRQLRKAALMVALALGPIMAFGQTSTSSSALQNSLHQGTWSFLLWCFGGGLIALLTPCVFPMVPVTVSFFAKRTHRPLASALIYALGIIATFAVVGLIAATFFGAAGIGRFAANPWVNIALGALFVVLAMNLFGFYEFRIGLASKIETAAMGKQDSLISPFLVGMAFSLTSFTCTGPIIAALLALAAQKGGTGSAALGMSAFGLAFSLPFFALAMFPVGLGKMPKSGQWLGAVKPALGFIELAAALKFFSNADLSWQLGLLTRPVFVLLWGVISLALALHLFNLWPRIKELLTRAKERAPSGRIGVIRGGLGVVALLSAALLFASPHGKRLTLINAYLPNDPYPFRSSKDLTAGQFEKNQKAIDPKAPIQFLSSYQQALKIAQQENRPVFVDFTGVNCTNCRWMEENVFPVPDVHSQLASMVTVQLYTDRGTPADNANQDLQQKISGTIALPVYVLVAPNGKVIKTFEGRSDTSKQFSDFLKASGI